MSSSPTSSTPTIGELNRLIRDEEFPNVLDHIFPMNNETYSDLRHFSSLSRIILARQIDLQQLENEQEFLFQRLEAQPRYQVYIRPIFRHYRTHYPERVHQARAHPYTRPLNPSSPTRRTRYTPSPRPTNPTPDSPQPILSEMIDALLLPYPPLPSSPAPSTSAGSTGSREDPIVVSEDEFQCPRCGQWGHLRSDCDANIRRPGPCEICAWKQQTTHCDHYEPSPAWIKRQQRNIAARARALE
jgi:hypothetical protein